MRPVRWILNIAWWLLRPWLFLLDAERAHRLVIGTLAVAPDLNRLAIRVLGGAPAPTQPVSIGGLQLSLQILLSLRFP